MGEGWMCLCLCIMFHLSGMELQCAHVDWTVLNLRHKVHYHKIVDQVFVVRKMNIFYNSLALNKVCNVGYFSINLIKYQMSTKHIISDYQEEF